MPLAENRDPFLGTRAVPRSDASRPRSLCPRTGSRVWGLGYGKGIRTRPWKSGKRREEERERKRGREDAKNGTDVKSAAQEVMPGETSWEVMRRKASAEVMPPSVGRNALKSISGRKAGEDHARTQGCLWQEAFSGQPSTVHR